jgi:hypothetical protein
MVRLLLILPLLLASFSCTAKVENIPFSHGGEEPGLRERPGIPTAKEGRLTLRGESISTPRYYLPETDAAPEADSFLFLEYESAGIELVLDLGSERRDKDMYRRFSIPATPEGWLSTAAVPLGEGVLPVWFRFSSEELPAASRFLLRGSGTGSGSRMTETGLLLVASAGDAAGRWDITLPLSSGGSGVSVYSGVAEPGMYVLDFTVPPRRSTLYRDVLDVSYSYESGKGSYAPGSARLDLVYGGGQRRESYRLSLRPGSHTLSFLPSGDFSGDVRLELEGTGFSGARIELRREARWMDTSWKPLPADIGEMLHRPASSWRRSDFELYAWNLFPKLLIFDYRDYSIQASMLKRLAFFVEKKESAGTVLPNEKIEHRHGWNAHDYRSEDLARFFTLAAAEEVALNPDEILLRTILLKNGIIEEAGEMRWKGVDGGLLSLSRESSARLRYLFLVHEGYHGLFFTSEPFRDRVFAIWETLTEEEKNFWKHFLDWKRYNVDDPYLLVNEFMAYLMQQSTDRVEPYFYDYIIPSMTEALPELLPELENLLLLYPDHFIRNARLIEEAAFEEAGLLAGDLFDSVRIE